MRGGLAIGLLLVACRVSLPDIPEGVEVRCDAGGACPGDLVCDDATRRCIEPGSLDAVAPALAATPAFEPELVGAGMEVTVELSFTEALAAAPVLYFEGEAGRFDFEVGEALDASTYVMRYHTVGVEPQGSVTLSLEAEDRAKNPAQLPVAGLSLDFEPPAADPLTWDAGGRTAVRTGDLVTFGTSIEPGAVVVSVELQGLAGNALAVPAYAEAAGVVSGSFTVPAPGQSMRLELRLRDAAGNVTPAGERLSTPIPFDMAPPSGGGIAFPAAVVSSQSITLEVWGSGASAVRLTGDVLEAGQWLTAAIPGSLPVTLTAGAGDKTVTAELRDGAWNVLAVEEAATTLFDPTDDHSSPRVVSANAVSSTEARLFFSEALVEAPAELGANYVISQGLEVATATWEPATKSVLLTTETQQQPFRLYLVTVSGVGDPFGNPLAADGSAATFSGFGLASPPEPLAPAADEIVVDDGTHEVELSWTSRFGTGEYLVELYTDEAMTTAVPGYAGGLSTPDAFHQATLVPGLTYWWRVHTDLNDAGVFSPLQSFALVEGVLHVSCPSAQACEAGVGHGTTNLPFQTIGEALSFAASTGGAWTTQVAARGGAAFYDESLVIGPGVSIVGGYEASFTQVPDGVLRPTRLYSDLVYTLLISGVTASSPTLVEGLSIRAADDGPSHAVLVEGCDDGLVLRGLELRGSVNHDNKDESFALTMRDSGDSPATSPLVEGCRIFGADSGNGNGAARITRSAPTIRDCEITGGRPFANRSALVLVDSGAIVEDCRIVTPPEGVWWTLYRDGSAVVISASNVATAPVPVVRRSRLEANVIVGSTNGSINDNAGIFSSGPMLVANNVIVVGDAMRAWGIDASVSGTTPADMVVAHNLLIVRPPSNVTNNTRAGGIQAQGYTAIRALNNLIVCEKPLSQTSGFQDWSGDPDSNPATPDTIPVFASIQNNLVVGCSHLFMNHYGEPCYSWCYDSAAELNDESTVIDGASPMAGTADGNMGSETVATIAELELEDFAADDFHPTIDTPAAVTQGGKDPSGSDCGPALASPCGDVDEDKDGHSRPGVDGEYSLGPFEYD